MPVERSSGGTTFTGPAVYGYRAAVLLSAINLYLKTGMFAARGLTVTRMCGMAAEYTERPYSKSRKGLELAAKDLGELMSAKSADEIGEARKARRAQP